MKNNGGLIVAAGLSSRMGYFKPLLKIGNKTFIDHIISKFKMMKLDPIVIVAGHNYDLLREKINDSSLIFIENEKYDKTDMFYSIKLGLELLQNKCDRVFMTPCDNPLFEIETMKKLLEHGAELVIPTNGKSGHPILIKNEIISDLLKFQAKEGLKSFLQARSNKDYVEVDDPAINFDADYFRDYEKMLNYYNSKNKIKSIYFLRHGDIERKSKEKIYYGRTDFKLSELGKIKTKSQIDYFKDIEIGDIYTSPLSRCLEGALLFKEENKIENLHLCDDLMEIDLGAWEGKTFSYIKENHSKDFIKRGQDENFRPESGESLRMLYDRAFKVCQKIISSSKENVVIFTHKGLIQSLLAKIEKDNLLKAWDYNIPAGSLTRFDLVEGKLELIYYGRMPDSYPSDLEIMQIYEDLSVEPHIIRHMVNVMNIAKIIGESLNKAGYKLDLACLRAAALLHDIKRKERHHEAKSARYLEKLGYIKLAKIIADHNNYRENIGKITETDILYLADKYSLEDNFVSIDQRFEASLKKCLTEEAIYYHDKRYEFAKNIEKIIEEKTNLNYKIISKRLSESYEKFIS